MSRDCIFCNRRNRIIRGKGEKVVKTTTSARKSHIFHVLKYFQLQSRIEQFKNAAYIMYHVSCFNDYKYKVTKASIVAEYFQPLTGWSEIRNIHATVFSKFEPYLVERIVSNREIVALSDVYSYYSKLYAEEQLSSYPETKELSMKSHHLLKKIFAAFPVITKTVYKSRTFLHRNDMQIDEIFSKGFTKENDLSTKIKDIAMEIRKIILQTELRKLPKNNISLEHITKGECDIPEELRLLIEYIVQGPQKASESSLKQNKISAICSSIILTASNGLIKPSICLTLGLTTKSLTGCRRMIEILNRMGHCVSYTVTEEMETELAYACSSDMRILPYGLIDSNPRLHTHVAFDNYDKYVETSTGKDTLHDTVGIVYQNMSLETLSQNVENNNYNVETQSRRRKYFSAFDNTVNPYLRKRGQSFHLIGSPPQTPDNLTAIINSGFFWMFNHAMKAKDAKKWFAWHSDRLVDENPIQKIGYLPSINMSPTSESVILKTLETALQIADETNQDYIIVTYDLAIASKAYKIKIDLEPQLDRVFINLGAFHLELSFFKVSTIRGRSETIIET